MDIYREEQLQPNDTTGNQVAPNLGSSVVGELVVLEIKPTAADIERVRNGFPFNGSWREIQSMPGLRVV